MGKFTKKPVTIDAVQWFKPGDHPAVSVRTSGGETELPSVRGKQGAVRVDPGDWIIQELDGSGYYPCKPDVFAQTYFPTSRDPSATGDPSISLGEAQAIVETKTAPRITFDGIKAAIADVEYFRAKDTLTICIITMRNGFHVLGKSACASPENYDQAVGERYAYDDAFRQIWALEAYALKNTLSAAA
ncbi:Gp49 family protein [Methylobacterium brachythecii]|uniref:Uncharacterized protein n=1 Tax=Methylobacterium brachythecii TaxID=1176177 RepID=A0A7W6ANK9_9HYPH|nr:Gp49 family protein [Methylobacterium brachythecii]MBB3905094.1 hypothetical protein [Methylobacterium brachythecii]GLS44398.1 hypothetical protein GCM10007884_23860 [Methylobacterium brachythecii]